MMNLKSLDRGKTRSAVNMKKHLFCVLAFALIAAMPLTTCDNGTGGDGGDNGKVFLVDVSKETDWDYLVVAKDGSSAFYNVDETGIPTSLFFKPDKKSDKGTTILFKENGLPDRMVHNGYILVFGNFSGYQFDMAVIKPDNTITYHYDIQTDVNWDVYNARAVSGQGRAVKDILDLGLDIAGHAMGLSSCVATVLINPAFGVGCASYLASEAGNLLIDQLVKAEVLNKAEGELAHTMIDVLGCMSSDALDCIIALNSVVNLLFGEDLGLLMQNRLVIETFRTIEGSDINWKTRSSPIFNYYTQAIAYGGGKLVAGSSQGELAYSYDGENWIKIQRSPLQSNLGEGGVHEIAYGNGIFVAVGSGGYTSSTDGINWTDRSAGPFSSNKGVSSVAFDGFGAFVAGDGNGTIASSDDGVTWTYASNKIFGSTSEESVSAIACGGGNWVAGSNFGKIVYRSGETWTAVTDSTFGTMAIGAIAYGDGRFVAVGNAGKIAYSDDGRNWTAVTDRKFGTSMIYAVAYGAGRFIAGGADGKMAYSRDGINWTVISEGSDNVMNFIQCITYAYDYFVAGYNKTIIYSYWSSGGRGGDTTEPILSSGSVNRTSDTQAAIDFTSSEAGFAYYLVQDANAAAPANTAIRNGMPLGAVTAGANSGKKVVTLTAGAKDIYVVVEDAAGNISEPLKITAAAYSGGGGGGNIPVGGGLTISNLPSGGDYAFSVFVFPGGTDISTYETVNSALNSYSHQAAGVEPSGGVFNLLTQDEDTWTGTGTFPVLLFNENGTTEQGNPMFRRASVNFTNGTATANFSGFTAVLN